VACQVRNETQALLLHTERCPMSVHAGFGDTEIVDHSTTVTDIQGHVCQQLQSVKHHFFQLQTRPHARLCNHCRILLKQYLP
jgi:hypothetical protein